MTFVEDLHGAAFMTLRWPWIAAFAAFVACIPLFAWNHCFWGDWPNHLAMIGYVGEALRAHGALPTAFHTSETVGRATPLFYGGLSLPVVGTLAALLGARAALTVVVASLLALQFASVRALVRDATDDDAVACAAAVIVTWAIYPLTDLYNRAAIPEFLAITSLQAGACLWAFYARDPARRGRASVAAGLLLTFAAGVHPPTALVGGLTFAVMWIASLAWCPDRRRLLGRSFAIGAAAAGVLAPWLYVLGRFGRHLHIVAASAAPVFFPTTLDAVGTRLSLMPTVGPEPGLVSTPNLDPQISLPLGAALVLLTVVALVARRWDRAARRALLFAGVCSAAMWALFALSTSSAVWDVLPKALAIVQFPYRLVAFINLAALGALTGVLAVVARGRHASRSRLVLGAGVVAAAFGVGLKLPRCLDPGLGADALVTDYANPPQAYYFGGDDYATPEAFSQVDAVTPREPLKLPVGGAAGFGVVGTARVRVDRPTQLVTNVQAFPWNVLTLDGHAVAREATLVDGVKLATLVGAGAHEIGYELRPDRTWVLLRRVSLGLLAGWALAAAWGRRGRESAPPD